MAVEWWGSGRQHGKLDNSRGYTVKQYCGGGRSGSREKVQGVHHYLIGLRKRPTTDGLERNKSGFAPKLCVVWNLGPRVTAAFISGMCMARRLSFAYPLSQSFQVPKILIDQHQLDIFHSMPWRPVASVKVRDEYARFSKDDPTRESFIQTIGGEGNLSLKLVNLF